jgi:hypothetical protein
MATIATKEALLEAIHTARSQLEKKFSKLSPKQMTWPGSMDDWSVKDILAHLVDWEQRFIGWYQAGLQGEIPETPAPGMTWRELPKLNKLIYERYRDRPLEDVLQDFHDSYNKVLKLVEDMSDEEIFTKGFYAWTGNSSLETWIAANTYKHYNWARRQIRTTKIRKEITP